MITLLSVGIICTFPTLGYLTGSSSMAPGLLLGIVFIGLIHILYLKFNIKISTLKKFIIFLIVSISVIILTGLINISLYQNFEFEKYIYSIIYLIVMSFAAILYVDFFKKINDSNFLCPLRIIFIIFLTLGYLSLISFNDTEPANTVIIFTERSHFSLVFAPLMLFTFITSESYLRLFYIVIVGILVVLFRNTTLLASYIISIFFIFNFKILLLILFTAYIISITQYSDYITGYITRLTIWTDTPDLSQLVYLSGVERGFLGLKAVFGLGFQQLGYIGEQGRYSLVLGELGAEFLNLYDGGTLASKFIAEFGIFGLFAIIMYLIFLPNIIFRLKKYKQNYCSIKTCFFYAIYITFFIELFVRSTGYFNSGPFLFLCALFWIFELDNNKSNYAELN